MDVIDFRYTVIFVESWTIALRLVKDTFSFQMQNTIQRFQKLLLTFSTVCEVWF